MKGLKLNLAFMVTLGYSSIVNLLYIRGIIGGTYYHLGYMSVICSGFLTDRYLRGSIPNKDGMITWHRITLEACQYLTILLLLVWLVTFSLVLYFR